MAKNSTTETEHLPVERVKVKKFGVLKVFKGIFWGIVVLAIVAVFLKNPNVWSNVQSWFEKYTTSMSEKIVPEDKTNELNLLKREISSLRGDLSRLADKQNNVSGSDIEELKNRFVTMEETNLKILDAKANASTVLSIVDRLDKLEEKVDTLARVTDDSALILTAVLMVKDTAERGMVFSYEAEILSQLAQNNIKIKEPIAVIEKTAKNGVKSDVFLVNSFDSIYKEISKQQKREFEKSWKDRINNKLSEFIKVRRTNQSVPEYEGNKPLDEIKTLVDNEDFSGAMILLKDSKNKDLIEKYQTLEIWMKQVQNKLDFNMAIKQIANNSLAVMKVNSIKKEISND